ncbi:hypothetical protein [Levilactobacillus acidifarinae]|uniref:Uncharacterized protein n=1 Tax=Levilactobacillus acidifarinae DSM 19394 = JCM 15949 TaxID=1423715 RepID=A0A0R1LLT2_9LACO|nr:hypothetical protein [Levilactobacillus acidifarinae]KRK96560.1 hypothetical protein FD25_GL002057 [Levilactobacillus acidifarinae DSM 19394]GEO70476.1 hypothetical protein LAC03_23860 [Levilactobacillus acidifarinae]
MDSEKMQKIAASLDGMNKSEWNTVKQLVDVLFERKTIEAEISLNSSEIIENLKKW